MATAFGLFTLRLATLNVEEARAAGGREAWTLPATFDCGQCIF
jgi:hypothetical protein